MGGPQVIVGQNRPAHEPSRIDPILGWSAIRTLAILFVLAGLVDIAVAFYPPRFSEKAWLFGVLGGVLGGLPVLSLGLAGGLIAAISLKAQKLTRILGLSNLVLAALIFLALVFFLSAISEVRRNAAVELLPGITRNIVRTTMSGLLFFALHATAFRVSRRLQVSVGPNH